MPTHAHPLDPLTAAEIETAAAVVRRDAGLDPSAWFETISLQEPEKAEVRAWKPGAMGTRRAFVACYEPKTNRTFDGVVDLTGETLERWRHVEGVQARIVADEFLLGDRIAKEDPRFVEALRKRGITDLDSVQVEPWSGGYFGFPDEEGRRIAYGHCTLAAPDNSYGRPIANLHPVFDLAAQTLIRVDDLGVVPLPPPHAPFRTPKAARQDLKPLEITQKDGPSFTVEGRLVRWQRWHIRVGYQLREGLVLHDIGYEDKGRIRPIIYRASMSEMVVPYGDPTGGHYRKNAFDVGEYGVGQYLDSLTLGCDCLGHIHYFDAVAHDWQGAPRTIENAICMHEEDYGILWKYKDFTADAHAVRRSRRLVISSLSTIGNYVYGFFWYFYQDGTIGVEVKATGIPLPAAIPEGDEPLYGSPMAPGIDGTVHQHIFSYRFDMAVDGDRNAVREVDFEQVPMGKGNPHGNAIRTKEAALRSEGEARREVDSKRARYWKVINPSSRNRLGKPVAYKLVPGTNAVPFLDPESPVGKRAGFMFKHFWATRYAPDELYAAGWYPNQHRGGDGLPAYAAKDRPLEGENVVVWYTLNYHHLPRPEDWPVQPCVYAGFHWMPLGFFDQNPTLDVPESEGKGRCCS